MRHRGYVSCSVRQAGVGARRGCRSVGGKGPAPAPPRSSDAARTGLGWPVQSGLVPCGMRSRPNGRARTHKPAQGDPADPGGRDPEAAPLRRARLAPAPGARDVGLRPAGLGQDHARRDLARRPPGEAGLAAGGRRRRRARHVLPLPRPRGPDRDPRRAHSAPRAHARVPRGSRRVRARVLPDARASGCPRGR